MSSAPPEDCPLADWGAWLRPRLAQGDARLIELHTRLASTQDVARDLIRQHGEKADGALVVADEQTRGRGRLGRRWCAPPGTCLLLSRVQILSCQPGNWLEKMSLGAAVALARALEEAARPRPIPVRIKWPNDLLVNGAKLAGLLLEMLRLDDDRTAVILGLGLNVALLPAHLSGHADLCQQPVTSLAMLGHKIPRPTMLIAVMAHLDDLAQRLEHGPDPHWTQTMLRDWKARSTLLGERLVVRCDGRLHEGTVLDIDPLQGLLLHTDHGTIVHLPAATSTILRDRYSSSPGAEKKP